MQHAIVIFRIKWVWIWLRFSGTRVPSRGAFFGRKDYPRSQKKKKPTEPQVANIQKPATTRVVHTRGRQCVCDFSGFSKRIPRLEHPRVVCTFPTELRKIYLRVILIMVTQQRGDLYRAHT